MALSRRIFRFSFILLGLSAAAQKQSARLNRRNPALVGRQACQDPTFVAICPGPLPCVPAGATCCSDGQTYALPPATCPDGSQPNTIVTPPPATSTPAISSAVQYSWFTTEITWSYWLNYMTIFSQNRTVTTSVASYQVSSTTTVSVTASDSDQASSLFDSIKATMSFATPTGIAFVVTGAAPSTTRSSIAGSVSGAKSTSSPSISSPSSSPSTSSSPTSSSATISTLSPYSGAESVTKVGATILSQNSIIIFIWSCMVAPGFLMLWF